MNKNELHITHKKVHDFFLQHINEEGIEIKKIKKIHHGLTNESYCISTNKGKYQVRFTLEKAAGIDREIEKQIYEQSSGYVYFDKEGNMIRSWIRGRLVSHIFVGRKLKKVFFACNKFHLKNVNTTKKVDFTVNANGLPDDKYKELFNELLDKFNCIYKYRISHNDLNVKNVVYKWGKIYIIDYEWAKLNFEWFDYIYFLIHTYYPRKYILKNAKEKMHDISCEHFFFISYFCWSWANKITNHNFKFNWLKIKYKRNALKFYKMFVEQIKKEQKSKNHYNHAA